MDPRSPAPDPAAGPPAGAPPPPEPGLLPRPPRANPTRTAEGRFRSSMLRRFGALYWLSGLGFLLRNLRLEDHSAENIRQATQKGPLVYVLHTESLLDWLAVNRVLNRRRLPLARYTHNLSSTAFRPVVAAVREWGTALWAWARGERTDPLASGWLTEAVAAGTPACVFIVGGKDRAGAADPVEALLAAQARSAQPIQLVPLVVVWSRAPEVVRSEAARFVLGSADEPGPLQKLWAVLTRSEQAIVQAGAPLDLLALQERLGEGPVAKRARAARILLRRYLYRESHTLRGPRIRPYRWTRRIVLTSPEVRKVVQEEAAATGRTPARVFAEVDRTLDKIAARMSYPFVRFADHFCRFLFTRIFNGVDMRPEDAERIRAAFRQGTPILVPCHRSHLDYILISWVCYQHDIFIPHVCAGDNLAFFPLGTVLRRVGGFFIKRSFKGERVFPVVFERYIRQLIRDGFPIEFYLEGGRSRTGKLLPAKHGVLSMVLDAAHGGREDRDAIFLPMAICYEQIAEEGAYARELGGEKKKGEDLGQVVKASQVIQKRYGKVYLRVGEPLPARGVTAELGVEWPALSKGQRKEVLQRTGERLMVRIAKQLVCLPTGLVALGLLAQSRSSLRFGELRERCGRLLGQLMRKGTLGAEPGLLQPRALAAALGRFEQEKVLTRVLDGGSKDLYGESDILQVVPERRITLEYYKNSVIHAMAPLSLMAAALRGEREAARFEKARVCETFRTLTFLLRYEFTLDPDQRLDQLEDEALADLLAYGAAEEGPEGTLLVPDPRRVAELAELTRNFIESYLLVLEGARALRSKDCSMRELPGLIQDWGRQRVSVDELRRPEALSLANLQNAVTAFHEEGVIHARSDGGGLQLDDAAAGGTVRLLKGLLP
ncbi:MAG: hypothetical protein RL071_2844 [Pseudomonadota bacterium]